MQVAIAGMEDVGDPEAARVADRLDAREHLRQPAGGNGAVHADVVGDLAGGAEGGFAALPDGGRLHGRAASP